MKMVDPKYFTFNFSKDNPPALRVQDGDTVLFQAMDTYSDLLKTEESVPSVDMKGVPVNPLNGPVFVEGAMPGDTLKVTIEDIIIDCDYGTMHLNHEGKLGTKYFKKYVEGEHTFKIPLKDGIADLCGNKLECIPLIGDIGVAYDKKVMSTMDPYRNGGNMDCKYLRKGTTLYLPVFVEGALLSAGDLHAHQGDGEIVSGLEVPGKIQVRVDVVKNRCEGWPVLETEDRWYMLCSAKTIDDAVETVLGEVVEFLKKRVGDKHSVHEWLLLLAMFGDLEFCEVVDPYVLVRYGIDKKVCEGLEF